MNEKIYKEHWNTYKSLESKTNENNKILILMRNLK